MPRFGLAGIDEAKRLEAAKLCLNATGQRADSDLNARDAAPQSCLDLVAMMKRVKDEIASAFSGSARLSVIESQWMGNSSSA